MAGDQAPFTVHLGVFPAAAECRIIGDMTGLMEVLWREAPPAFGFLVAEHSFEGPRPVPDGLRWDRPGLAVLVTVWARHHEPGLTTSLRAEGADGQIVSADLDDVYVGLGLGPAQHRPIHLGAAPTVRRRMDQHATALGRVLVALAGRDVSATLRASRR